MVQISKNNALAGQFYLLCFMSSCSIVQFERGFVAWKWGGGGKCRKIKSGFCRFFLPLLHGKFNCNCHGLRKIKRDRIKINRKIRGYYLTSLREMPP